MNTQNIPKRDKTIKRGFIPKLDAFLFFDYDQIELRLLAFYMATVGDCSMVEAFRAGRDIHEESTKAILGKDEVTDAERDLGKTFDYATIYGQGVKKCALVLSVSEAEAWHMLSIFKVKWPGISLLSNLRGEPGAIQRQLQRRGYISTLHGRCLRPESPHKSLNTLIQGTAADIMRHALIKIWRWLKENNYESHLVNAVHDESILDCIKSEVPSLVREIPILMRNETVHEIVPMEVSCEYSSQSWADKASYQVQPQG